jgi:hypothetical protein
MPPDDEDGNTQFLTEVILIETPPTQANEGTTPNLSFGTSHSFLGYTKQM